MPWDRVSPYGNTKVTKTIPKALLSMPSKEKLLETQGNGHFGTHNNDLNMEKETLPFKSMEGIGNTKGTC